MTVFFTSLTGLLIVHGATVIHRDTLDIPTGVPVAADCSTGLHRAHDAFATVWNAQRDGTHTAVPSALERELLALRPICEREGDAGSAAYEALLRWRYRAEGQTHVWDTLLTADAERALGYHSPPAAVPSPPPGSSR